MRRRTMFRWAALVGLAALAAPLGAQAQPYPAQDIKFICGFPAGTGADAIVRFYAEKIKAITGKTIIVENRPGAGANIAIEYVGKAKPDGYTILVHGGSGLATNMQLYKQKPVPTVDAFQIFATINRQAFMMTVDAKSPYKSVADVTAAMKAKGSKGTYGTGAPASVVMGAIYKQAAGLDTVEVNYKTSADVMNDMLGGNLDYAMMEPIFSTAQQRQGRLRILGVSSAERLQAAPDLPTFLEQNIPISMNLWWAAMVPAQTPKPIQDQLTAWFNQVTSSEEAKKFLNNFASDPWVATPEEAQATLRKEVKDWGDYMRIAKMEPQG
jgi:tripartite-type tricarboxylate transporter receptor subunit TctC